VQFVPRHEVSFSMKGVIAAVMLGIRLTTVK